MTSLDLPQQDIANYNSYNQIVISTTTEVFDEFISCVKAYGGRAIPLKVNRPFHHLMMLPAANKFKLTLDEYVFNNPISPVFINTTGEPITSVNTLHQKLYEQIFKPVQWIKTINNMMSNDIGTFYEVSTKPILSAFIKDIAETVVKIVDEILEAFKIKSSLSKKGCPYDNAIAEARYKIIKTEFEFNRVFKSLEELKKELRDLYNVV